jgi:hypothetical protein
MLETDAIVATHAGPWAAFEVKLGGDARIEPPQTSASSKTGWIRAALVNLQFWPLWSAPGHTRIDGLMGFGFFRSLSLAREGRAGLSGRTSYAFCCTALTDGLRHERRRHWNPELTSDPALDHSPAWSPIWKTHRVRQRPRSQQ